MARRRSRKSKKVRIPAQWRRDAIAAARMMRSTRRKRRKPCKVYTVCKNRRELCRDRFGRFISNRPA